jgi:hypothetical protein
MSQGQGHERDYTRTDVEVVFSRGDFHSWQEVTDWLRESGEQDGGLAPAVVQHMLADLDEARRHGDMFTRHPAEAYVIARSRCRHHEAA